MTRNTQKSMNEALQEIAGMMIDDGYTAAEVTAVADGLRQIKSSLWDEEKATGKDLGTKMIGSNAWLLDKVAIYMEACYDDYSRTYEAAAYIDEVCAEIIDPIYNNNNNNNDNDDDDDNTAPQPADDSWMDRRCYTTIRAKDAASGQRVDVDPPTWRDKLEMEHQLREDGYEFVDVTTDGGRLVILWYRPMMPRPMVDDLINDIKGC